MWGKGLEAGRSLRFAFCLNKPNKQILGLNEAGDPMPLYHENTASVENI